MIKKILKKICGYFHTCNMIKMVHCIKPNKPYKVIIWECTGCRKKLVEYSEDINPKLKEALIKLTDPKNTTCDIIDSIWLLDGDAMWVDDCGLLHGLQSTVE